MIKHIILNVGQTTAVLSKSYHVALKARGRGGTPGKGALGRPFNLYWYHEPSFPCALVLGCKQLQEALEKSTLLLKEKHILVDFSFGSWRACVTIRPLQEVKRALGNLKESRNLQSGENRTPLGPLTFCREAGETC